MTDDISRFETGLSTYDRESVEFRGQDLTEDIMGEYTFGESIYLMLTGETPSDDERRTMNAMLSALMVHGTTPHAIAAQMTYLSAPESVQGAVASGVLGAGSRYLGAMKECSTQLRALKAENTEPHSVADLVEQVTNRDEHFLGLGHPFHEPVDPRAERLFVIAEEDGVADTYVDLLKNVQSAFQEHTGQQLPINITGAIAAVSSDLGVSPTAAKGIAIISRTAGIVAEINEEEQYPMAMDIWQAFAEQISYTPQRR